MKTPGSFPGGEDREDTEVSQLGTLIGWERRKGECVEAGKGN